MIVASWPLRRRVRMTFAPALPPPAIRTYMGLDLRLLALLGNDTRADSFVEGVDRGRGRTDRAQSARRVEVRPRRVEDPDDGAVDPEAFLGDLADHEIGVVAVRACDDGVGILDAGLLEDGRIHAVADDEPAGPVLSEAVEGGLLLVDRRHVPPFRGETLCDRR